VPPSREVRRLEAKWKTGGGWPKRLDWIEIKGLRGWTGQRFDLQFPIMALVGDNGSGKSTVLQAAASVYGKQSVRKRTICLNPADQLGHRLLIKYVRADEGDKYNKLTGISYFTGKHYLTPTPIACRDLMMVLALPPSKRPKWALLLRPDQLTDVRGPRRIRRGFGIEYVLENGFSSDAMDDPPWVCPYN
jgi:hypothetical protein